jgi:hypothetical protein
MASKQFTKEILDQFVEDFYDLFMEGVLEFTNKYTILYKEELDSSEARSVIDLGLAYDWLWVTDIEGTPLVYIEIVDLVVQEHLLQHYTKQLGYQDAQALVTIKELKDLYLAEVVRFLNYLPSLIGEQNDLKPFAVASLVDEQHLRLDKRLVPTFHLSLTELFKLLESVQLRPYGFWDGQEHHKFKEPKGYFDTPLKGIRVDELVSAIFIRGVYPKRKSVHD